MQYVSDEDDFDVPADVGRLSLYEPVSDSKYVMYRGTTKKNARAILKSGFQQSTKGMLGPGVYLSRDLQKASRYPIDHPESDRAVIKVLVNVGRVIAINRQNHPHQKTWHDHDYDTAWVPPKCGMTKSGLHEVCVWDPDRIQITEIITPLPVQPSSGYGAYGYNDTDTNMQYESDVPADVGRLSLYEPVSDRKYVMYHGTTKKNARAILKSGFQQSTKGMLGPGVYLSRDLQKASRYPIDHPESDWVVIKVLVKVRRLIAINRQKHPHQKTWHDHDYDTAWVPPNCGMTKSGLQEVCVWDPNRIQVTEIINPLPVQPSSGYGAYGCNDTDTNMQYEWAEDDFDVPAGVSRLGLSAPVVGKKYIMYVCTTKKNTEAIQKSGFQQSVGGMLGPGVYLSRDLQKASRYPIDLPESDRAVIKVLVDVGKVIAINHHGHPYQKSWHDYGYDTAWVPPNCGMTKSGLEEDCVWDPNRIQMIKIINPIPVQPSSGCEAYGFK